MNVVAVELGNRPVIATNARRFAPEGVKLLAEVMGHLQFAEDGVLVLDWSNETVRQPDDAFVQVVYVQTFKRVGERTLMVEVRLDVEDTFGKDTLVADDFLAILSSMEDKMNATIERAKE